MNKSHTAVWASEAPTPAQLKELFSQIDSGRVTKGRLQAFLRGKDIDFPTWKTIRLGTHETTDALFQALTANGCRISDWANDLLKKITVCPIEVDAELVVASVADLGFPNGATRKEIYERAAELGLKLCPPEVGPQLRLQYNDQPGGEWLLVAMEPITDSHGRPDVFDVARGSDGLWLYADDGGPAHFWYGSHLWVFLRRK